MSLLSTLVALCWASPLPGPAAEVELLPSARPAVGSDGLQLAPGSYAEVLEAPLPVAELADQLDGLLERASGRAPAGTRQLRIFATDPATGQLVPARSLLPAPPPVPVKEPWRQAASLGIDQPGETEGFLSGKAVYISQCHGWIWNVVLDRFATQRGNLFDTVEDFHNPEGANQYLVRYLENMGAKVYTAKERDVNPEMAIVDDGDAGYVETGSGFADGAAGFAPSLSYAYGVNPFDQGGTRTFPADGGAVASWTPPVPSDGHYAVYVSWDSDPGNATDAHYRITHPGGVIDRTFDQTVHGSTWQYVETLWLPAGTPLTVELVGDSGQAGKLLSADAVRVGGGMSQVTRQGENPNRPRWEVGAIQYTQFNGAPTSVYDPGFDGTSGDGGSDPSSRSRWAEWEHPAGEDAVYLSWHSNAASSTARGTVTYWAGSECSSTAVTGSDDLAEHVQAGIIDNITALRDPAWNDRGTATACFSEVSPTNNDEMPAALVELAFHDNADDAAALKDPTFRLDASRGMAQGIASYFADRDGVALQLPPEPPLDVAVRHDSGVLTVTWAPPPSGTPYGDAAATYVVYRSADGRSWDNGTQVSATSFQLAADLGETVFVRVAAKNAGGISFPSELVGGRLAPSGQADALVVAAFDRLDAGLLDEEFKHSSLGDVKVFVAERTNAFDIARAHGQALADAGYTFDAVSDEVAATMDLSDYPIVVWATGEESTVDETFSADQQAQIEAFVVDGGALMASGAEMLWDLDFRGDVDDQAFALGVLGAGMESDASASTDVDGEGPLAGIVMDFGDGAYPVEFPDVLASGRAVIARYGDGGVAGVSGSGVATFGFPFDAIASPTARASAMEAVLAEIAPDVVPIGPGTFGEGPTTTNPTDTGTTDTGTAGPTTDTDTDPRTDPNPTPGGTLPPPPPEKKGCGCQMSGPGWMGALALVGLLVGRRR